MLERGGLCPVLVPRNSTSSSLSLLLMVPSCHFEYGSNPTHFPSLFCLLYVFCSGPQVPIFSAKRDCHVIIITLLQSYLSWISRLPFFNYGGVYIKKKIFAKVFPITPSCDLILLRDVEGAI